MARVTVSEVRGVLSNSENAALTDNQVQAAIDAATIVVDGIADAECHTDDSLKAVELYLSADFAVGTTAGGTVEQEKIGDASQKFAMAENGQSQYYRIATMLDCSNQLGETDKRAVGLFSIGSHGGGNTRDDSDY